MQYLPEAQAGGVPRKSEVPFAPALIAHTWFFRKCQCEPGPASLGRGHNLCQTHLVILCQANAGLVLCAPPLLTFPQQPPETLIWYSESSPEKVASGSGFLRVTAHKGTGEWEEGRVVEEPSSLGNPLPTGLFPWRPPTQ